jgi:hypothetical protein
MTHGMSLANETDGRFKVYLHKMVLFLIFVCNLWGRTSAAVLPSDGAVLICFFNSELEVSAGCG